MTIARVASNTWLTAAGSGTSIAKAFGVSVSAGSLLVACATVAQNSAITFSDNNGNSWAATYISLYDSNLSMVAIGYCKNAAAGSTTVTASQGGGSQYMTIDICEYTGADTTAPADGSSSAKVDGSNHLADAGNITTSASGVIIALSHYYPNSPNTAGTGYTNQGAIAQLTGNSAVQDQIWSGAGTRSTAWATTQSYSVDVAAAFKEASGGGATRPVKMAGFWGGYAGEGGGFAG